MKILKSNNAGDLVDDATVEIGLVGGSLSPILRIRVFMKHKPEDHLTIWHVKYLSNIFGRYTPPGWFLKLIGQVQ